MGKRIGAFDRGPEDRGELRIGEQALAAFALGRRHALARVMWNVAPRRLLAPAEKGLDGGERVIALAGFFDLRQLSFNVFEGDDRELRALEREMAAQYPAIGRNRARPIFFGAVAQIRFQRLIPPNTA